MAASTFLCPKYETVRIGDAEVHLYPISAVMLFRLRSVAVPVFQALGELMSPSDNDTGVEERTTANAIAGVTGQERIIQPISADLARVRSELRSKAIENAVIGLASDGARDILMAAIMDSMRETHGPRKAQDAAAVREFAAEVDAPSFVALLKGLARANDEVLAPFKARIPAKLAAEIQNAVSGPGAPAEKKAD